MYVSERMFFVCAVFCNMTQNSRHNHFVALYTISNQPVKLQYLILHPSESDMKTEITVLIPMVQFKNKIAISTLFAFLQSPQPVAILVSFSWIHSSSNPLDGFLVRLHFDVTAIHLSLSAEVLSEFDRKWWVNIRFLSAGWCFTRECDRNENRIDDTQEINKMKSSWSDTLEMKLSHGRNHCGSWYY